ncbi:MAG: N-acetylmuramoyl-L-alanine amidase [Lachnospiraceae bacterium]|nr:N-acetylmuramoyl-L-alanine amidase [Lachnospiraceae bacterium]
MKSILNKHNTIKMILTAVLLITVLFSVFSPLTVTAAPAKDNPVVVVIDAGNGGKSTGCEYFDLKEKDLNLAVAKSVKSYLERFDNVKVLLTRKDDKNPKIAERANYAKAKKADYVISIHFNESEFHKQTGSEIYVPSNEKLQEAVMPIAQSVSESLQGMGIYNAGIYTCTDSEGKEYYGLIRNCEDNGNIPAMIIEHLYMDREEYLHYIDTPQALDEIGKNDAIAIARALNLNSNSMIYKFEGIPAVEYSEPYSIKDSSKYPEDVTVSVKEYEQITNRACLITFSVNASNANSVLSGYRVSTDGGKTYSELKKFDYGTKGDFTEIIRKNENKIVVVTAYSKEGLSVTSNALDAINEVELDPQFSLHKKEAEEAALSEGSSETVSEISSEEAGIVEITSDSEKSTVPDIRDHDPKINATQSVVVIFGAFMGLAICAILYFIQKKEIK